ncbi:P-loop NTPase fold protein [Persephonella sp.]
MEHNKNLTKDIENNLKNILKQKLESVTVIKGKWGIGKTHFIKNFLDKLLIEDEYKFEYVYVSLFNNIKTEKE